MSFLNPWMLLALGAAVVPVVLHLVRKREAKRVVFAAMRFLEPVSEEVTRRRRLEDVLLMLARIGLIALLALTFARPFLPQEALPLLPERTDRSVVLVVDRSFSMQQADGAASNSAFEAARREALARIDALGGRDELAVVAFDEAAAVLADWQTDRAVAREVVQSTLAPTYRRTDVFQALQQADELLRTARHETREVVFISDFQQAGWSEAFENWKLTSGAVFVPVAVGPDAAVNAYIEAFNLDQKRAGPRVVTRLDARVRTMAPSLGGETLRLVVGDAEQDVRALPEAQAGRASFQQAATEAGTVQGRLALTDDAPDALPADDAWHFAYAITDRPSVLVVDGEARGTDRDAFFLRSALALGDAALYAFDEARPADFSTALLRQHDVLILANLPQLTAGQTAAVEAFVDAGGTAVVAFGPRTNPVAFSGALSNLGVGAAEEVVRPRAIQGGDAIIGDVDLRHPIFSVFATSSGGAIFQPQFRRYVRLAPDSAATVIARFDTGDPFLVERSRGQGRVLAYASAFSTAWSDFPVNELYVPFVYQLMDYALRDATPQRQFLVGDVVALPGAPGETWEVRTPDDRLFPVQVAEDGSARFTATDVPGPYLAVRGTQRFAFAVNIDPAESDLARRDVEEAYAAVVPPADDQATTPAAARIDEATVLQNEAEQQEQRQHLWKYLLGLAVMLFAVESVGAHRRGRG